MTTPSVVKLCGLAVCSLVALSACDKKNDVPINGESSAVTPIGSDTPTVSCDSASIKNSLVQALSEQTHQAVGGLMANFANSSAIDLPRLVQARLAELSLDFQNIQQNGATCTADITITLPTDDIIYADRYYAQTNTSLDTLTAQKSLTLNGTQLTSPIHYRVDNGQAILLERPVALELVAEIMSGSAYMRTQGAGHINTNARQPITVKPLTNTIEPYTPQVQQTPETNSAISSSTDTDQNTTALTDDSRMVIKSSDDIAPTAKPITPKATPSKDTTPSGEHELVVIEGDDTY